MMRLQDDVLATQQLIELFDRVRTNCRRTMQFARIGEEVHRAMTAARIGGFRSPLPTAEGDPAFEPVINAGKRLSPRPFRLREKVWRIVVIRAGQKIHTGDE